MISKKTYIPAKPRNKKLVNVSGGGGIGRTDFNHVAGSSHEHPNKVVIDQILQQHLDVLGVLSIVDGNLKIDANAYSTGELSAYGLGSGGSSGGGVDLLQAWTDYDVTKDNWAVKAGLLVPFYNDAKSRLTSLEGGAALSLNYSGSGNGVSGVSKSGTVLTVTKANFAELDVNGKILSSQLPSYVDDVLEYVNLAAFPATGETGKIYIAQDSNKTYRWSGTAYVEISASLALGETSSTAYRGDRGKTAYDHSQAEHQAIINGTGFVKANGKTLSYDNNSYSLSSHDHSGVYEPVLGSPATNGYLLSSTTAGVRSWVAPYSLPTASASVLGGVKIGANVSIASGVISVHNPLTIGTANGLSLSTQVLSLALATTAANGALSSTDKTYIELLKTFFEYDSTNNAIKALKSLYSTGEVSAYGIGSGGSSGGSYERLDKWVDYDSTKAGWVLSAFLGKELDTRVINLENGSALTVNTTGTGNAITSISKAGSVVTANKDLTFLETTEFNKYKKIRKIISVNEFISVLADQSENVKYLDLTSFSIPISANTVYDVYGSIYIIGSLSFFATGNYSITFRDLTETASGLYLFDAYNLSQIKFNSSSVYNIAFYIENDIQISTQLISLRNVNVTVTSSGVNTGGLNLMYGTLTGFGTYSLTGNIQQYSFNAANIELATTTFKGAMSAADKAKLDGIAAGAKTGTVTSVAMTVPTGLSVSGSPITTSGTLAVSLASGYSIPTTAKQTQWDTAYTHSQASHDYLPLTGGTLTGNLTAPTFIGSLTGNASSASKLQTARAINGTNFDGTAAITTANWGTARTLSFTGDVTGSASVNGSANVATAMTLANSGVTAGTYRSVTVDAKGRVTAGTNPTTVSGYGLTDAVTTNTVQTITAQKTFNDGLNVNVSTAGDGGWSKGIIVNSTSATSGEAAIAFTNISTGTNYWIAGINQSTSFDIAYGTTFSNAVTKLRIDIDGNVGIGTVSPTEILDVTGNIKSSGTINANNFVSTATAGFMFSGSKSTIWNAFGAPTGGGFTFVPNGLELAAANVALSILANKYVGVNTSAPTYNLDVTGTGRFTGNITTGANLIITPVSGSTDGINYGSYKVLRFNSANNVAILSTPLAGTVYLRPNGDGSATGQVTVSSAGLVTLSGALTGATTISASSTITATGNLLTSANLIANTGITIAQTVATGFGLSLYGAAGTDTSTNPTYGIMFATTASKGTHGAVTGTHATYFTMSNTTGRGWIFTTDPVGTTGNVASISNSGNITASGEITAYVASDRRLKHNITPLFSSLDIIDKLNPVSYYWNAKAKELNPMKSDGLDYGLIAQEVENVLPGVVHGIFDDKYKSIDYIKLIPILIGAVKELKQKVNKL